MTCKDILKIKFKPLFLSTPSSSLEFFEGNPDINFLAEDTKKRIFVTDSNVYALESLKSFFARFELAADCPLNNDGQCQTYSYKNHVLVVIPAGEANKTMDNILYIEKAALFFNFTRKDTFTAIGGGVITDMTAFASSIFKRGAKVEFVPTTLLAMVDAAIGGKSGCDFESYKNMIGAFYPAAKLFIFPQFIQSLPGIEFISGFAEAFKTALLFDKKMWQVVKNNRKEILERKSDVIYTIITGCAKAKARIVEKDLTEKNIRMFLNLGHTFGHALETCSGLGKITHGEAVAWGIGRAVFTSKELGLCSSEYYDEVIACLNDYGYESRAQHPVFNDSAALVKAMKNDKKNADSTIKLILQKGIGKNLVENVSDDLILKALS